MSVTELRKQLRELRKTHCPPVSKLKKADVMKEIERLRGNRATDLPVEEKERKPRVKKEKKEMEVQADMEQHEKESMAEKMARLRAMRKIGGAVKKHVEAKKETKKKVAEEAVKAVEKKKEKKETEMMGMEDKKEKPRRRKVKIIKEETQEVTVPTKYIRESKK